MVSDAEIVANALRIDPDRSSILLFVGTKGSGKSEAARRIFDEWPYDRAVLDITGDAQPDDPLTRPMAPPWPGQLPEPDPEKEGNRITAWLRVSGKSATIKEDQDQAVELALHPRHRNVLLWVDEYGQLATAAYIPPNVSLALQSSRHYSLSMLLCFPRPRHIPTITMQQADRIFIYETPSPRDREVLTDNMGFPKDKFEAAYREVVHDWPEHSFMLWDKQQKKLLICPPLPLQKTHGPRA